MARSNSETVTTFGEVLHSANITYSNGSRTINQHNADNRLTKNVFMVVTPNAYHTT